MKKIILVLSLLLSSIQFSFSQCSPTVLEGFGTLSAVALYNTYITIGSVADGYNGEIYDDEYVSTLMDEQESMISVAISSLKACIEDDSEGKITADDLQFVNDMISCFEYLKTEASSLGDYASTDSEDALATYSSSRDSAWELIEVLLGLE